MGTAPLDRVEHDVARRRFVVRRPEGESELTYAELPGRVLDLLHTEVPVALRGRGLGSALVQEAIAFARASGSRIVPSCPFIARWLEDHPEEQGLVAGPPD
jgi:predicted GNAT family acetyltransferase